MEVLEDHEGNVVVQNLAELEVHSAPQMEALIQQAYDLRTTHLTVHNSASSRSHALCFIRLSDHEGRPKGTFIIGDLAGSERAHDTQSNDKGRKVEGAEINKSLLALKECIRAMSQNKGHVPFRQSKLTLVLRDSFT